MIVRERMESKEREIHGEWYTEERLLKSGDYTKLLAKALLTCPLCELCMGPLGKLYTHLCSPYSALESGRLASSKGGCSKNHRLLQTLSTKPVQARLICKFAQQPFVS